MKMRILPLSIAILVALLFGSWLALRAGNRALREQVQTLSAVAPLPAGAAPALTGPPLSAVLPRARALEDTKEDAPVWGRDEDPVVVPADPGELGRALGELGRLGSALEAAENETGGDTSPASDNGVPSELFGSMMMKLPPLMAAAQYHAAALATAEGGSAFTAEALVALIEADEETAREIRGLVHEAWDEAERLGLLAPEPAEPTASATFHSARETVAAAVAERLLPLVPDEHRALVAELLEGPGILESPMKRMQSLGAP